MIENAITLRKNSIKYIVYLALFTSLFGVASILLKDDFRAFVAWWLVLFALGIGFMPITSKIFSSFHDNGYIFSKTLGLAISGYIMWLLSSLKLVKFSSISCLIIVIVTFIINSIIYMKSRDKKPIFQVNKLDRMFLLELLFLAIFLLWVYIRGFKPDAHGTEKYMDFGFMASMMRSDYMPPSDIWYAGGTINYYYVGQFIATFLTKLSFVKVEQGYNLMMMTLAAMGFVLPFSLVYQITSQFMKGKGKDDSLVSHVAATVSGISVCFAGNLHFTLFYWIIPGLRTLLGIEGEFKDYWFPNSTRYIGYNPETNDKTIHEFPSYSFILGDLHAHVLNIIFVLTVLAILFAYIIGQYERSKKEQLTTFHDSKTLWKEVCNPFTIIIGFFIGMFHTTNFWDFPIYYVVSGAVILFSNMVIYQFKKNVIALTALQGIFIMFLAKLIALPFNLNFDQISTQVGLVYQRTPLYQLLILWALPIAFVIGLLVELIMNFRHEPVMVVNNKELEQKNEIALFRFMKQLDPCDLFILTIGLCAMGLVLLPELIYVKDIYSGDYKRANTMFKLTYQAFIMFGICAGYVLLKFIKVRKYIWQIKFTLITSILLLSTFWYSVVSVKAWYGDITKPKNYKGLDAIAFMKNSMPDDYEAVQWLNKNVKGTAVVLEANGDSYSDNERISMATGLSTVVGWYVHEWLWRGDTTDLDNRIADIETIYTSDDRYRVISLIEKYNIEYIYVGKLEQDKYEYINMDLLKSLGEIVFYKGETDNKNYESFLVHINPKG